MRFIILMVKDSIKKYIILLLFSSIIHAESGITYLDHTYWGGRLGDQLIMFVKAKILSHYSGIPLYIRYFKYADSFIFWEKEKHLIDSGVENLEQKVLKNISSFEDIKELQNKLFVTHYYFQMDEWGDAQKKFDTQEIMEWTHLFQNVELLKEIRTLLKSLHDLPLLLPPQEISSVAIHVRKPSGEDRPIISNQLYDINNLNTEEAVPTGNYSDVNYPTKCPPNQYYIDQLKYLYHRLKKRPLYVFIFTDYQNPEYLRNLYSEQCNFENVIFDCRNQDYNQVDTQVQDILSMGQYDYLIRSCSNFPQIAQLMGQHRLVISPKSVKWIGNNLIVDKVRVYEADVKK